MTDVSASGAARARLARRSHGVQCRPRADPQRRPGAFRARAGAWRRRRSCWSPTAWAATPPAIGERARRRGRAPRVLRSDGPVPKRLAAAFTAANNAIIEHAREHPECAGMGTTCTVLAVRDGAPGSPMSATAAPICCATPPDPAQRGPDAGPKLVSEGAMTEDEAAVSDNTTCCCRRSAPRRRSSRRSRKPFRSPRRCADPVFRRASRPGRGRRDRPVAARLAPQEACQD